ncbi:MAG: response regulator transcription factor [Nitrosomonadales bacterium]|nr:response regulator transcription factor [Nitrosomonadales bacterium]
MNVFIVEDSDIVREHMQSMLSAIPGVEVVGYAVDEQGAIERINKLLPDVVTLDISLQPGAGIKVLENIKKEHPAMKVIVLTNYTDEYYAKSCKQAGADFFFDKTFQFSRVRSALWSWINTEHIIKKVAGFPAAEK